MAAAIEGAGTAPYLVLSVLDRGPGLAGRNWMLCSTPSFVVTVRVAARGQDWVWQSCGALRRCMAAMSSCAIARAVDLRRGYVCRWACCCRAGRLGRGRKRTDWQSVTDYGCAELVSVRSDISVPPCWAGHFPVAITKSACPTIRPVATRRVPSLRCSSAGTFRWAIHGPSEFFSASTSKPAAPHLRSASSMGRLNATEPSAEPSLNKSRLFARTDSPVRRVSGIGV